MSRKFRRNMANILPATMQPELEDAHIYDEIAESTSFNQNHIKPVIEESSKLGSIKQIFGSTEKNQENFSLSGPTRIKLTDSQLSTLLSHQIRKFYLKQAGSSPSKKNDLSSGFFFEGATRIKITDLQASSVLYHQIKRHYAVQEDNVQNEKL